MNHHPSGSRSSTDHRVRRRLMRVGLALTLVAVMLSVEQSHAVMDAIDEERHWTGLALVGLEPMQLTPRDEAQAIAIGAALDFAMDHPEDVGYPWVDDSGTVLELSQASDRGLDLLEPFAAQLTTPHRVRQVEHSLGELERLGLEITSVRGSGVAGEELIYTTEPDWQNSRIIVTVSEVHDELFKVLAERFGTEALAVRVNPNVQKAESNISRQADVNPFTAGSRIFTSGCTTAFSWANGSAWEGVLTAAHCHSTVGQTVKTMHNMTIGDVEFENWVTNEGTVPYPGQTMQRGDVALIRAWPNRHATAWMWRGGANSTEGDPVKLVWARWSLPNDGYCVSGATSGEVCDYWVHTVGMNVFYWDEGAWADNMVFGRKLGSCTTDGDSGSPVFTIYGTGVAAKGVHSGGFAAAFFCDNYFTDIQHPVQALPGTVKVQP